jgi:hypothetical protein
MTMSAAAAVFRVNPAATAQVQAVGDVGSVLVVDGFYADPDAVRAQALASRYDSSLAYYPGLHSPLDASALQDLFGLLGRLLGAMGNPGIAPSQFSTDFSVVTTPASEMLAEQKHPHVDGQVAAGVVYLNPQSEIGTCFFRHLPTGWAVLQTPDQEQTYARWLRTHGAATQPSTYAVAQDGVWQRLHHVAGRYNRLVMYPGNLFHSIDMRDIVPGHTMASARLTQRIFVNPPAAGHA